MTQSSDFDWSKTPLGPRKEWSPSLRTIHDLMMSAHVAMCAAWGPEQTFLYNAAYAPFLGARHPAALGQPIRQVWPDVWGDIEPLIARAMAGERVQFTDHHLVMTRNGQPEDTYWDFSYSALRDDDEVVGFLNITTEATQHVVSGQRRDALAATLQSQNSELEQQVNESAAELKLFRDVVQASSSPISVFDDAMRLVAFNKAQGREFERVYGVQLALGDVFPDRFPFEDQAETMRGFIARTLAGETFTIIQAFGHPDRATPDWELTYAPLRDEAGAIIGAFHLATDVSERLRAEAELASAQQALRQSQKMEAVGQLTGGLAHDFNNLLTAVTGGLDLLKIRIERGQTDQIGRYVDMAQTGAMRAAALTQRLLAFSRRQTLDPTAVSVDQLVIGMEDIIDRTIGPSIETKVIGTAGLWPVLVDAPQLENALLNLCINARDAMPDGGRLTIETGNKALDARSAAEHELPAGEYVSLCVSDTGTGMSPETIERIFDPFFTTKPLGEGTGLGLSMIYGFTRQSGGQVRVYSEVGQGTTMCLYLPRHLGDIVDAQKSAADEERRLAEQGQTVLIVEDEAAIRALVTEVLQDAGYRVLEASTGPAGVQVLQGNERIDLLITDVGLPGGLNGRQVADAGRTVRPDLKVLFVTGYAANAAVGAGHLDEGMAVLTKPFNVLDLEQRVHDMVKSRRYEAPQQ